MFEKIMQWTFVILGILVMIVSIFGLVIEGDSFFLLCLLGGLLTVAISPILGIGTRGF